MLENVLRAMLVEEQIKHDALLVCNDITLLPYFPNKFTPGRCSYQAGNDKQQTVNEGFIAPTTPISCFNAYTAFDKFVWTCSCWESHGTHVWYQEHSFPLLPVVFLNLW